MPYPLRLPPFPQRACPYLSSSNDSSKHSTRRTASFFRFAIRANPSYYPSRTLQPSHLYPQIDLLKLPICTSIIPLELCTNRVMTKTPLAPYDESYLSLDPSTLSLRQNPPSLPSHAQNKCDCLSPGWRTWLRSRTKLGILVLRGGTSPFRIRRATSLRGSAQSSFQREKKRWGTLSGTGRFSLSATSERSRRR
jgi:hypothetical protein